jgi:hypothetical protein
MGFSFQFKDPARHPQHPDLYAARLETFGKGKQRWWPHDMVKGHGANSKAVRVLELTTESTRL